MARVKRAYSEGDWFIVPNIEQHMVVGIIARDSRRGILGGFFFGPYDTRPNIGNLADLKPEDAILVCQFGDGGLTSKTWDLIGRLNPWNREQWKMPVFVYWDPADKNLAFARTYDDDDPSSLPDEQRISISQAEGMPQDGLFGSIAVEIRLRMLVKASKLVA